MSTVKVLPGLKGSIQIHARRIIAGVALSLRKDSGFRFLNQVPVSVMAAKNTAPKQGNAGSRPPSRVVRISASLSAE
jgi:hypothetical protein